MAQLCCGRQHSRRNVKRLLTPRLYSKVPRYIALHNRIKAAAVSENAKAEEVYSASIRVAAASNAVGNGTALIGGRGTTASRGALQAHDAPSRY
jgi:hypothetical protein